MKVYEEMTPYEFLQNHSWCCEDLKEKVTDDYAAAFNDLLECIGEKLLSKTELNDIMRFDADYILENIGLAEDDED